MVRVVGPPGGDMHLCARFSCVAEMNAVAPVNVMPSARGNATTTPLLDEPTTGPRWERMIEQIHSLGPRPLAEMLDEIAIATGEPGLVADRVAAFAALDPEFLRAIGGDKFPPNVLGVVR